MVTTSLGTWQIAGNDCTATLVMDRPRSINIALEWGREPGPAETEHFNLALPESWNRLSRSCSGPPQSLKP